MCNINKGPWIASLDMYIGRRDLLSMDHAQLQWKTREDFLSYTSAMWKEVCYKHKILHQDQLRSISMASFPLGLN